ncbi:D-alanine--D-alanine ligase [Candidatus Uhrbacteria bacterium]|nr:D-alanine--D-alanine ligase [Candidatus Uhrbacteria bacterium]
MGSKMWVGIIFGGGSAEHEISLLSALNIINALDREKYEPVLIGIDTKGEWFLLERDAILNEDDPKRIALDTTRGRRIVFAPGSNGIVTFCDTCEQEPLIDVAFPILHGPFGEDGTVQGLLKLAGIPFVGAGVLGSSVGMDKDVMKRLLRDANIPIGKFVTVREDAIPSFEEIALQLGSPLFVKPANLGSSIGIGKGNDNESFQRAVKDALQYDSKILIEEYVKGREIECAVLDGDPPLASIPGEIIPSHEFYSYEAKYLDEHGATTVTCADLPVDVVIRVQELAVRVFQTLCCEGFARVDFFVKENGDIVVNEINTIPGFTQISMYPKMMEATGISCPELIDRLIQLAIKRFEKEQKLKNSRTEE